VDDSSNPIDPAEVIVALADAHDRLIGMAEQLARLSRARRPVWASALSAELTEIAGSLRAAVRRRTAG
jgi:hypothetical protein